MKAMLLALAVAALLCVRPASAVMVRESCINSTHELLTFDYGITTDSILSDVDYTQNHLCGNGCSTAINACRPDSLFEMLYMAVFVAAVAAYSMFGRWVSKNTDSDMDAPILLLGTFFCVMIAAMDLFSATYRTIILGSAFIPVFILYISRREAPEEDEVIE